MRAAWYVVKVREECAVSACIFRGQCSFVYAACSFVFTAIRMTVNIAQMERVQCKVCQEREAIRSRRTSGKLTQYIGCTSERNGYLEVFRRHLHQWAPSEIWRIKCTCKSKGWSWLYAWTPRSNSATASCSKSCDCELRHRCPNLFKRCAEEFQTSSWRPDPSAQGFFVSCFLITVSVPMHSLLLRI